MVVRDVAKSIGSISCDKTSSRIYDIELEGTGIFNMSNRCKCYTGSTILVSSSNESSEHIGYLPVATVLEDECCIKYRQRLQENIQMEPIKLQNLNLDDLRHSQYKLEQVEEIIDERLRVPFSFYHISWFATTVGVLLIAILIIICCYCCCNCSWLPYVGHLLPRRRTCCGLPSICITNHNERLQINEEQMMRLDHLRSQLEESNDRRSVCSRDAVPSASANSATPYDLRSRKFQT